MIVQDEIVDFDKIKEKLTWTDLHYCTFCNEPPLYIVVTKMRCLVMVCCLDCFEKRGGDKWVRAKKELPPSSRMSQ